MSNPTLPTRLLTAIAATGLMLATTAALAQDTQTRAERRAEQRANKDAAKAGDRYPGATRQAPPTKTSSRANSTKLGKLSDAYEAQDLAQTLTLADEIIADETTNAYEKSIAARIAGALALGEDDDKALDYLQRALQFDGLSNNEHYEAMSIVGQLQAQQGDYEQAVATTDRLLQETASQDGETLVRKGSYLRQLERYPEAIATLRAAIDGVDEPNPAWQQQLLAAYMDAGQAEEATRIAEQIAASTPDDKRSQLNLAVTYLQGDQYARAAEVYERLRARGELTEDREYRNLMVSYLNTDDGQQKAIDIANEGLEKGILEPDYQTYVALAQAYYFGEPQRIGEAIEAYRKAAPLASNGETYLNLAKLLSNEGRLAEAKQAAQQALDKGIRAPDEAQKILARK